MRRIFVISDLHLGGRPDEVDEAGEILASGFQICHSYEALIRFVDWVRDHGRRSAEEEIELVLNGDIIDFLAEDTYSAPVLTQPWTDDQEHALTKFNKAVSRTSHNGRTFFDSLKDFTVTGKHRLTLLLGNHDPELSLPRVRERLMELLGGSSPRLRFLYDGEAYCEGRLLIEHGNRYDRWNMIDHSGLRQERSVLSRRLKIEPELRPAFYFVPPAGTFLVTSFINGLKRRYRFIDLLKPEDELVLPLLAVLEPDYRPQLDELFASIRNATRIGLEYRKHRLATATRPERSGDLGTAADSDRNLWATLGGDLDELSGEAGSGDLSTEDSASGWTLSRLLTDTWRRVRSRVSAISNNSLAVSARIYGTRLPEDRFRRLHQALCRIARDDTSFSIRTERATYLDAARATAEQGGFDVVIYGHTHLPKEVNETLRLSQQPFTYINTGTWSSVMRLPFSLSGDLEVDRPHIERFIGALGANDYRPFIKAYLSYAEVELDSQDRARAALRSYCGPRHEREAPLSEYPTLPKSQR